MNKIKYPEGVFYTPYPYQDLTETAVNNVIAFFKRYEEEEQEEEIIEVNYRSK